MKCPRCQHENEASARFCEECATPLARVCSKCGRQLSQAAKFCPECAHPAGSVAVPASQRFGAPEEVLEAARIDTTVEECLGIAMPSVTRDLTPSLLRTSRRNQGTLASRLTRYGHMAIWLAPSLVALTMVAQAAAQAPGTSWPPPPVTVPSLGSPGAPPQPATVPSLGIRDRPYQPPSVPSAGSRTAPPQPATAPSVGLGTERYQPYTAPSVGISSERYQPYTAPSIGINTERAQPLTIPAQ